MKLSWHKLGLPDGRGGTLPDLKTYFGDDWNVLSKYFLPTSRRATSIKCPSPGGNNCPRKVVEHSYHDIVAVCGNSPKECEPVRLTRQDLIIHELNINKILSDLGDFLRVKGMTPVQFMPQAWELGTYVGHDRSCVSVYVSISTEPERLQETAISLIVQREKPFFLLVPSRDLCPVQLIHTIENTSAYLVGLDDLHGEQDTTEEADLLGKYFCQAHPVMEEENIFRLEKENWRVVFRGRPYTIRQSVGMQYITHLIQRAYDDEPEIHVSDLFYLVHKKPPIQDTSLNRMSREQLSELGLDVSGLGEGLDFMTQEGKQWVRRQVSELERFMEEAEAEGNTNEALRLREVKENLEDHIQKTLGLSGKVRKSSDPNERMRKAVSKSIRHTLKKLGGSDGDELAIYLHDHLDTGLFCSFRKDPNISWKIIKK